VLAFATLASVQLAEAQKPAKVPRVGYLISAAGISAQYEAFRQGLRDLGYVEGQNVVIEYRSGEGSSRLADLAAELAQLKVDVIVAQGAAATPAKTAAGAVPIVFGTSGDPVEGGFVASLARPGGNMTGLTFLAFELVGKRLEILKETVPKLARVAVLWDPKNPASAEQWRDSKEPAQQLGLQLHSMEVSSAEKYENAFKEAVKARCGAVLVTQSTLGAANNPRIVELAAKNRLPAISTREEYVTLGGLMSYGADDTESYQRAAVVVDKILKGAKPAELPVEQPTKFEFVINLKTAKQIGLTIPPNVLARADRVIK
jgi:putative tryptophan/tyrosine transport system substrate-binding protein